MYDKQDHAGNTPEFWEENWERSEFEKSVAFCAVDPLRPLFEKYLHPDSLMLEGGCGVGNYVTYYSARGYHVVGLDFARRALKTLKTRQPGVKVCGGDVSCLPFADKTFDLYYSGGVVEHFEGGAKESLIEARRVLKNDGILLISVPYYNPLRKALSPFRKDQWRIVDTAETDSEKFFERKKFFQYAYTRREFGKMLSDVGLRILKTQGYAVLWGLYEIPFLDPNGKSEFTVGTGKAEKREIVEVDIAPLTEEQQISLLKRFVVSEDASVPFLGLGVTFLRWLAANMMMYVCRRAE
jgi:SAM-dependent methyltransferase